MRILSTTLALAAASLAVPAVAAGEPAQVGVRYSDLDLSTKAGQKELDRRLDQAAREVCGMDAARTGTRLSSTSARDCYRQARATLDRQFAAAVARETRGG